MAFTLVQPREIRPEQLNPMVNLIPRALQQYSQGVQAAYMPKQLEAEIFHKQISPLAMLASSPYFSSLHPQQQQQIAGYISQMLAKQGMAGQGANAANAANAQASMGSPYGSGQMNQPGAQGESSGTPGLAPQGAAEHFTGKFTESPYSAGTPHNVGGKTVYTPTSQYVQEGLEVLKETKDLDKLFDEYAKLAPDVAKAGSFRRYLSPIASNIEKTGFPGTHYIAEKLGGAKLSNEEARMARLQNEMMPGLRALKLNDAEINRIFMVHPGETDKNIKDSMKTIREYIKRKRDNIKKTLHGGIEINQSRNETQVEPNVNELAQTSNEEKEINPVEEPMSNQKIIKELNIPKKNLEMAPPGSVALYKKGFMHYIPLSGARKALTELKYRYEQ